MKNTLNIVIDRIFPCGKTVAVTYKYSKHSYKYSCLLYYKTKLLVHDAQGLARVGANGIIKQSRRISKRKHYELIQVLN